jgi:hypothetical protein
MYEIVGTDGRVVQRGASREGELLMLNNSVISGFYLLRLKHFNDSGLIVLPLVKL